nr:sulfate ABC transporter substrate-binding protein [Clostridium saccharoperbutylacetonicum]
MKGEGIVKKNKGAILVICIILFVGIFVSLNKSTKSNAADRKSKVELLNVSYDPTREFYSEFNASFSQYWKQKTGQDVSVDQSHGGSGAQARSVSQGLDADIVTLALGNDIDQISKTGLIKKDWQNQFNENSAPYTSTIVFLVRKGNPKNIRDWDDLIKNDVSVITPNPKTSGGARWNYLAAWAYAAHKNNGDQEAAKDFVSKLYSNVKVLDSGARAATTTFVQRKMGDVLIAWENEAYLALNKLGKDEFEIITPSLSILAEPPVAIVDEVVDRKGTREVAKAYLDYLYSKEGQEIAAQNYYRPRDKEVAEEYKGNFQDINLVTVDKEFGGWAKAQATHFADGGTFDQIYKP